MNVSRNAHSQRLFNRPRTNGFIFSAHTNRLFFILDENHEIEWIYAHFDEKLLKGKNKYETRE